MAPLIRHLELAPSHVDESISHAPRGRLIGRDIELAQLLAFYERGERFCTLIGWAGQGKTRLARAVAQTWAQSSVERVARFVDLTVETNAAEAIDRAFATIEPAMVVIDTGERFDASLGAQITEVLDRAPFARVLVTARAPLGSAAEMRYWLTPLSLSAGVELFLDRTGGGDRVLAEKIVGLLGGHPLSIELAAAQNDVLSFAELHDRLSDRFRVLRSSSKELPERHRSIEAAIAGAVAELLPREEEALSKCAAIGDSFTLAEAECVLKLDPREQLGAIDILRSLVSKSFLLSVAVEGGARRFVFAPNVRAWLAAQAAPGERPAVEINLEKRTVRVGRRMIGLRRRRAPWLVIARLAAERETRPGSPLDVRALTEAGWPGERISPDAAAARVYFVIRELRKAGLEEVLLTIAEGYLLDPAIDIVKS